MNGLTAPPPYIDWRRRVKLKPTSPLAVIGLSGALAFGVLSAAGVALAQQDPTPEASPAGEDAASGDRLHHWHPRLVGLAAIIEASGLDRQVFLDGFEEDKTVAEILEENGLDPEQVKADVLAKAEEALDAIMNSSPDLPPIAIRHFGLVHWGIEELSEFLGMTEQELIEALRSGDTVAEIAEAAGIDPEAVIDALVADAQEKLAEAVENGRISQEQADEIAATLEERITTFVNEGGPWGGDGPAGGRQRFRFGRGD
jgi:hypothetical protein